MPLPSWARRLPDRAAIGGCDRGPHRRGEDDRRDVLDLRDGHRHRRGGSPSGRSAPCHRPGAHGLRFRRVGRGHELEAAAVEQLKGSIMSSFHVGFSLGMVTCALLGTAMNALHVSVTVNLLLIALLLAVAMPLSTRGFLLADTEAHVEPSKNIHPLTAWVEPRTLLIGLFVLTMAFAEGTAND